MARGHGGRDDGSCRREEGKAGTEEGRSLALRDKSNWIYSPAIKSAESKLKDRKTAEQNNGTAACNVTQHLVINFSARIALQSKVEA